jgi:tetratricopeptide (TPR) repeat protein
MRRGRAVFSWLLSILLAATSAPVEAESPAPPNDQEGRRQYKIGEQLLSKGQYKEAAEAFEAGYAASPRAGFLLNIANCHRKLGDLGKARHYFWRFLDAAPKNHPSRPEVIEYLKTIEQITADGLPLDSDAPQGRPAQAPPPPPLPEAPPVVEGPSAEALPAGPIRDKAVSPPRLLPSAEAAKEPGPKALALGEPPRPVSLEREAQRRPSILSRWWFWTLVGGAVTAGTGTLIWARASRSASCEASLGCLDE